MGRWPSAALAAAVLMGGGVVAQTGTGVPLETAVRWIVVLVAALLVPGLAIVRTARRGMAHPADDLAWAMPAGLVATMVVWGLGQALGHTLPPWSALAAVALVLAVPGVRRRMFRPAGTGWSWASGTTVVAAMGVALAWTVTTSLAAVPVVPGRAGFAYTPDTMFQAAMTGELARAIHPTYPMVAGEPISYHWFYYAIAAQLGQGLDTYTVACRFLPVTLLLALALLVASVARQISGRASAAALGACLVCVVANTLPAAWVVRTFIAGRYDADGAALDPIRLYWQISPTQTLGWVAAVAAFGVALAVLRSPRPRLTQVVGLLACGMLTAGAKSSAPPVLICGVLFWALVSLVRRQFSTSLRALAVTAALGVPWVIALTTVYGGGSYGMRIMPGDHVNVLVRQTTPALAYGHDGRLGEAAVLPSAVALIVWLAPLVPRLFGLLWLSRLRPREPAGWIGSGAVLAGLAGTFLTRHPGQSEIYFLVSAYPLGLTASAAGIAEGLHRVWTAGRRRALVGASLAAAGGIVVCALSVGHWGTATPLAQWRRITDPGYAAGGWLPERDQLWPWLAPHAWLALWLLLLSGAVALLTSDRARRRLPLRSFGAALTVAALGGGLVPTWLSLSGSQGQSVESRRVWWEELTARQHRSMVTAPLMRAADMIREEAAPGDVVATNRVCVEQWQVVRPGRPCTAVDFTVSALTGLRSDVAGWGYAGRVVSEGWAAPMGYTRLPFWDPRRLADEQRLIRQPSRALADRLWAQHGVRWILADKAAGPWSPALRDLGEVVYDRGGVIALRLRPPARAG